MSLLDRYIIKQFVLAIVVSLAGFIIIYVAIDLMEKLDKFLDRKVPALVIVEYYVNFIPQIISVIMPVGLLLGSLFATGRMSTQNEIIAMRSAGMSLYRFMAPFLAIALLVSLGSIYFNGWILPKANARVLAVQREHVHENLLVSSQFNLHLQESKNRIVLIQDFNYNQARASRISIQEFDPQNLTRLVRRIDASGMTWDSTDRRWELYDAKERAFGDSLGERFRVLEGAELKRQFTFTPEALKERQLRHDEMTNPELRRRIDLAKRAGQETSKDEVDYYAKYAMAFTSFIVVLFGVPFASRKKRGGLSLEFSVAIFIAFVFLAFTKISQTFGYTGQIDPILTAWLANTLFLIGAVIVVWKAQK